MRLDTGWVAHMQFSRAVFSAKARKKGLSVFDGQSCHCSNNAGVALKLPSGPVRNHALRRPRHTGQVKRHIYWHRQEPEKTGNFQAPFDVPGAT